MNNIYFKDLRCNDDLADIFKRTYRIKKFYPRVKYIEWWKMVDRNRKRKRKFVPYTFLHEQSKTTKLRQHAYIKIKMEGELSSCHEKPKERLTCSKTYTFVNMSLIIWFSKLISFFYPYLLLPFELVTANWYITLSCTRYKKLTF